MENNTKETYAIKDIIKRFKRLEEIEANVSPSNVETIQHIYNQYFQEFYNGDLCFDLVGDCEQYIQACLYIDNLHKNEGYFIITNTDCETWFDDYEEFIEYADKLQKKAKEIKDHFKSLNNSGGK